MPASRPSPHVTRPSRMPRGRRAVLLTLAALFAVGGCEPSADTPGAPAPAASDEATPSAPSSAAATSATARIRQRLARPCAAPAARLPRLPVRGTAMAALVTLPVKGARPRPVTSARCSARPGPTSTATAATPATTSSDRTSRHTCSRRGLAVASSSGAACETLHRHHDRLCPRREHFCTGADRPRRRALGCVAEGRSAALLRPPRGVSPTTPSTCWPSTARATSARATVTPRPGCLRSGATAAPTSRGRSPSRPATGCG